MLLLYFTFAIPALADVYEEISFSSYVDEPLYIDLAVMGHSDWTYYDLYVEPYSCSYVDFWADTPFASYSACAYGEFSDDFYGCIEGNLADGYIHITMDFSGVPYLSDPPRGTCDIYAFESPYDTGDYYVYEDDGPHVEASGGCFIGSLTHPGQ